MLTLRTRHLTRLGATRVGVTTRADCGQSTLAFPAFLLFPFVLVLLRDSLGNGLRGFGAAEFAIWRGRALIIAPRLRWPQPKGAA
jgi:hypothetical protein